MLLWDEYFIYRNINLQGNEKRKQRLFGINERLFYCSNVVEKCVTYATREEKRQLIDEVVSFGDG